MKNSSKTDTGSVEITAKIQVKPWGRSLYPGRQQDKVKQHISARIKASTPDSLGNWEHGVGREPDNKQWAATALS